MSAKKTDKTPQAIARSATRRYAQALATIANAFDALYEAENHGMPRPGSLATSDAIALDEKFTAIYGEPPGDTIAAMLNAKFAVAIDHLRGTEQLFLAKKSGIFSVWATARSAFEALGEAYWLSEPGIDPKDRMGRVINMRLLSLRGAQWFVEKGNVSGNSIRVDPYERETELLDRVETMGLETIDLKARKQVAPPRPTMTQLVDDLVGAGAYSLSSAMSHGEVWAMMHHLRESDAGGDPAGGGRRGGYFQVSVEEYRALAAYLHTALGLAVGRLSAYDGWDDSKYQETHAKVAMAIRR